MLWDTLERVNRARQQAMANTKYLESAKAHQKALQEQSVSIAVRAKRKTADRMPKKLSDIYQQVEFGSNPSGREH